MIYAIEDNHLTEQKTIFDKKGLQYHLEITNSFDEDGSQFSAIFNLVRDYRNCNVGRANCLLFSDSDDALLGDILIFDNVEFYSINDKLYRLFNWNEPINYQKRGLGTILLTYVIKLAKYRKAKKLHGSLTEQDLSKNPNLIKWYKKHGFKIEKPTADEVNSAVYRACLYLE